MSRIVSLTLQQWLNRLSKPKPSARSPSHSRWLCTLLSSCQIVLRNSALSGISTPIAPSAAAQYPQPCPKLQIPQILSMTYTISGYSFFSTSFSSPLWINPIEGMASTTFSSSITRSRWTGSGSTGCWGPKGIIVLFPMILPSFPYFFGFHGVGSAVTKKLPL